MKGAIEAYQKVLDYSPGYDMILDTKLALADAYLKDGDTEESYNLLDDMSSEDKNKDVLDRINLEKGKALIAMKKYQEAIDLFVETDTTFKKSIYAGAGNFELGKIYEYHLNNFDSALVFYAKASSSLLPPDYLQPASDKNAKFKKYSDLRKQIEFNKTQLKYSLNPDEFVKDSTEFYDEQKKEEEEI